VTTCIALLRGINVGGNRMVAMAALRSAFEELGFTGVKTLLQSGNVVFRGAAKPTAALEVRLEKEIGRRIGFTPDFHVRTAEEWRAIIAGNPFAECAARTPAHLLVTFFKAPLDRAAVKALQAAIPGREIVHADGRHLYMTFPDGIGRSKAPALMDQTLGVRGTARNWNTVTRLAALVSSAEPSGRST
jgi:uncharacterized protein (DUF1697 family)